MQSPRVYFNNIGSICTDSLRHGNGLSALLLLTRAAKSSAAKSSSSKTRSTESRLYVYGITLGTTTETRRQNTAAQAVVHHEGQRVALMDLGSFTEIRVYSINSGHRWSEKWKLST